MTTEKMNVHKALCELKTLDKRIIDGMNSVKFVFANKHSNTKIGGQDIKDVCDAAKEAYQSVGDLMRRRDALKRAVVLSNARTMVTVAGVEYTVAEAIEMKNNGIPLKQQLLRKLTSDLDRSRMEAERNNGDVLERRADENIKSIYGSTEIKSGMSDEVQKARADFIKAQTMELVDPIGVEKECKRLADEINDFLVDIDSQLSVSNATTLIEVSY